jgi:proline dehydrogenase
MVLAGRLGARNLLIDMEARRTSIRRSSVPRAIDRWPNVGICLQAYLYRSVADLESLLPLGPAIRLVKGAYMEPPELAYPRRRDVDANFYALSARLLGEDARRRGARLGIGTHDPRLVEGLQNLITRTGVPRDTYEFEMLYGIQRGLQSRLIRGGWPLRVLISYGEYWFPWYMRRLAERPANVAFILRSMVAREAAG